jgi:hypothetical protein
MRKPEVGSVIRCRVIAGVAAKAASVDQVGLGPARVESRQHLRQELGLVLAVAVHLHRNVVVVSKRVLVARLHRAADAGVEGVLQQRRSLPAGLGCRPVRRAVVHHEDVEVGRVSPDVAHDAADHSRLVVGGDDRELAQIVGGRHGSPGA